MAKRNGQTATRPTKTHEGADVGGQVRDISKHVDRASKSRTATSLGGKC